MNGLDEYDLINLTLGSNNCSIVGRTAIQKLIYFIKIKIPEIKINYIPHYYGPFSRDIAIGLENLVAFSFVEEKNVSNSSFEQFRYDLTDTGKDVFEKTKNDYKTEHATISNIVDTCNTYCQLNISSMSFAAKAHYIIQQTPKKEPVSKKKIQDLAVDFGWKLNDRDIEEGMNLLTKLDLVNIA